MFVPSTEPNAGAESRQSTLTELSRFHQFVKISPKMKINPTQISNREIQFINQLPSAGCRKSIMPGNRKL